MRFLLALFLLLLSGCVTATYNAETHTFEYRSVAKDIAGSFSVKVTKNPDGTTIIEGEIKNLSSVDRASDLAGKALDAVR